MEFDAVVLAGGRASRLDGTDKADLRVDGLSLLDRALAAVSGAAHVVVVGDERPTPAPVSWVREHPAYGGPVAATYAGLDTLRRGSPVHSAGQTGGQSGQTHRTTPPGWVVVLAVDMPEVTDATVRRLVEGATGREGAVLSDAGRRHLAFVAEVAALERVRPQPASGAAMRHLWASLDLAELPARGGEAHDVDEWSDLPPH